jgi:hypothetical protein
MSVTTSSQLNDDKLQTALVALAPGAGFVSGGGALEEAAPKTITAHGATDDQLQQAITTAAAQFVDVAAVQSQALTGLQSMLGEKNAWGQQAQADIAALQATAQPDWTVLGPILVRVVQGLLSTMQAHEDHLTVNGIIQ